MPSRDGGARIVISTRKMGIRTRSTGLVIFFSSAIAHASNVTEFPDNGSEQMGRGGAWVARASDPAATFYNPAGLAGQRSRLTAQVNVVQQQTCFTRVKANIDTTQDAGAPYAKACNDGGFSLPPNPVFALTARLSPKLGLGLAFLTPSYAPQNDWAEQVKMSPSPARYALLRRDMTFMLPTIGLGYEPFEGMRVGASFTWGVAQIRYAYAMVASNSGRADPVLNDLRADIRATDPFVPGATLGAIFSAGDVLDVGGWLRVSKPIQAGGDVITTTSYENPNANQIVGSTGDPNCRTPGTIPLCKGGAAQVQMPVPLELKLGVRLHRAIGHFEHVRDPLRQDKWDLELDLTWSHNGDFDKLATRLPGNADGSGVLPINGLMGEALPANLDLLRGYHDVLGVRLGGDYNLVPGRFALRAGGFFESGAQDTRYQSLDFMGGARIGVSGGLTWRVMLGKQTTRALEISLGFMHMFMLDQTNASQNGMPAISAQACGGAPSFSATCASGLPKYRTPWPVNLGTIQASLNAINGGLSYRF